MDCNFSGSKRKSRNWSYWNERFEFFRRGREYHVKESEMVGGGKLFIVGISFRTVASDLPSRETVNRLELIITGKSAG